MGLNWVFVLLKSSSLPRGTSLLLLSMPLSLYFSERGFPGQGGRPIRFPFPCNLQISSFGVIPKKGQPGKWHLIVDLSSPGRFPSVNDGINPDEFTLHYLTVDQIICLVSCLGKGHSWLNLMLSLLTTMFLFTHPTVFCWGWNGVISILLI